MGAVTSGDTIQLLLVEDEIRWANEVAQCVGSLNSSGRLGVSIVLEVVGSIGQAKDHVAAFVVDVILLDLSLPDGQGIAAVKDLNQQVPDVPIVVFTNLGNWSSMIRATESGSRDFVIKTELTPEILFRSVYHAYETRQLEIELQASQANFHNLVASLPVGEFRKDLFGRYLTANQSFCDLLGYSMEDIVGYNDHDLFNGRSARTLVYLDQEVRTRNDKAELEAKLETASGKQFQAQIIKLPIVSTAKEVTGVQGVVWDISERKEAQERQRIVDRFAGIESLTCEIVHNVKNRLAPVALYASLLETKCESPEMIDLCQKIISATTQSGETLQHLLIFSEDDQEASKPVDVELVLAELSHHFEGKVGQDIRTNLHAEQGLPSVRGGFRAIRSVLESLCNNAVEAMGESGTLTVLAEARRQAVPELAEKGRATSVLIRVQDTGPGVSPAIRDKIFDPYFTTKDPEQFLGMGLTNCSNLIRKLEGDLRLDTSFDGGACFEVVLPAIDSSASNGAGEHGRIESGSIMLVDDEESIVSIGKEFLEAKGFSVITARNGLEAIAKFSDREEQFDVVVTDLIMPQMDGLALVGAIRERSASMPIIVSTGLEKHEDLEKLKQLRIQGILSKPYSPDRLVHLIRQHVRENGSRSLG